MILEPSIAVLFARSDSVYYDYPECDVYDKERNALSFEGGLPVVAHPPCRAWGKLSHMAKPEPGERDLAIWAVDQVRMNGGVLEHPRASKLWPEMNLPLGRERDEYGGFSIHINQFWFGHRAKKKTLLYICGIEPSEIPRMPIRLGEATHVVGGNNKVPKWRRKPEVTHKEREATPQALADWLVDLAFMCRPSVLSNESRILRV